MLPVLIGAGIGMIFGALQVWVISRVVSAVTADAEPKKGAFIWVVLQFLATVAVLAALGFYAMSALIAAACGMIFASVAVWLILSKKTTGKES